MKPFEFTNDLGIGLIHILPNRVVIEFIFDSNPGVNHEFTVPLTDDCDDIGECEGNA